MSDRLLTSVIELETALQMELHLEEARAAAWRIREFASLGKLREEAVRETERRTEEEATLARQQAEAEGKALCAAGALRCTKLNALTESFLVTLLQRHLATLWPEVGDDHPHGES